MLAEVLEQWPERFQLALVDALLTRLGVGRTEPEADRLLARALLQALASRAVGIDRLFFDWRGGSVPEHEPYRGEPFQALAEALAGSERPPAHPYWSEPEPCSMRIEEVEAVWARIAQADDWSRFETKVAAIRRVGDAMREPA